jgi:Phage integrase family
LAAAALTISGAWYSKPEPVSKTYTAPQEEAKRMARGGERSPHEDDRQSDHDRVPAPADAPAHEPPPQVKHPPPARGQGGDGEGEGGEGLIFCTQLGRPLSRFNLTRDLKLALRRAGLAPMRFHDLRHTSATLMLLEGVHLKQMGARLGHVDIQTTAKYAHLVRGLDREAAERLERAIRAGTAEGEAAAKAYLDRPKASRPARGRRGEDGGGAGRPRVARPGGAPPRVRLRTAVSDSRKGSRRQTARSGSPKRAVLTWRTWSGREDLNLRPPEPH